MVHCQPGQNRRLLKSASLLRLTSSFPSSQFALLRSTLFGKKAPLCVSHGGEGDFVCHSTIWKITLGLLVVVAAVLTSINPVVAREKYETIDATVYGTSSQMGANIGMTLVIYEYSTADDRGVLVQAFQKGQSQGLCNALKKMKSVGRIAITGTLGYDVAFIRMIPTETGRKIRFITNRQITFGEAWTDSQSMNFNLTAGELDLYDKEKNKSSGVLYPATQLVINNDGEPQWELNQNPWRVAGIIDWKGTPGEN